MPEEKERSSDEELQKLLKKSADVENFPDVPLDEFTPPTDEEWKAACEALLKGAPFEKKMFTKTYEGITFDPMYTRGPTAASRGPSHGRVTRHSRRRTTSSCATSTTRARRSTTSCLTRRRVPVWMRVRRRRSATQGRV